MLKSVINNRGLQCSIPVFDGLLPEPHNSAIVDLLYVCAYWHGLAKLRMHTDHTLKIFNNTTVSLGAHFRAFVNNTCPNFVTHELQREVDARRRREVKKPDATASSSTTRRHKTLNLTTYKYHSLGDYPAMIKQYGTCDSYSTETASNKFLFFDALLNASYRRAN